MRRLLPAAGFLTLSLLPFLLPPQLTLQRQWRGYYTLALKNSALSPELAAGLQRLPGVQGVVSEHTAPLCFNTFEGMECVPLSLLYGRLQPVDPRFDPFMQKVRGFFTQPRGAGFSSYVYLRSPLNPLALAWRLERFFAARAPKGFRWRLLEFAPLAKLIASGLFVLFAAALLKLSGGREGRLLFLLGLAPWYLQVLLGDPWKLASFFSLFPGLWLLLQAVVLRSAAHPAHPGRQEAQGLLVRRGSTFLLLFLFTQLVLAPGSPALLACNLSAVLASLLASLLYLRWLLWDRRRRLHRIFAPLPILEGLKARSRLIPEPGLPFLLLAAAAALSLPLLVLEMRFRGEMVPTPRGLGGGSGLDWKAMERLALESREGSLPTLADFLTHQAYQEGLAFARPYRFPLPGERVTISAYLESDGGNGIVQSRRLVKRYQSSWLEETLARVSPDSVEGMLKSERVAALVTLRHESQGLLERAPPWRFLLAAVFPLAVLLLPNYDLTPVLLYGMRNCSLRRKRPVQ